MRFSLKLAEFNKQYWLHLILIAICTRSRHFSRLHFPTKTLCFFYIIVLVNGLKELHCSGLETQSKAQEGEGPLRDLLKTICPQSEAGRRFGQDHAPYHNESKVGFLLGNQTPKESFQKLCEMSKVTTNGMQMRPCSLIGFKLKTQTSEWTFSHCCLLSWDLPPT